MKHKLLTIGFLGLFAACQSSAPLDFKTFSKQFIQQYAIFFPDEAPLRKENADLDKIFIPTADNLAAIRQFCQNAHTALDGFQEAQLSVAEQRDKAKISRILSGIDLFCQNYSKDASRFNVLYGFQRIAETPYDQVNRRAQTLLSKLKKVPLFYEQAKSQLGEVSPHNADVAYTDHQKTLAFFEETLPLFFAEAQILPADYKTDLAAAQASIQDFRAFLLGFKLK